MCIAILNNQNTALPFEYLEESLFNNPDGFGAIWTEKNQLRTVKSMSQNAKKIFATYERIRGENPESFIALHFRVSTAGKVNPTNCHPFHVNENLAFVHNGIIGRGCKTYSDTWHFNEGILKKLPANFLQSDGIRELIAERITGSKLLFLDSDNVPTIINERAGHWDTEENWFSNESYIPFDSVKWDNGCEYCGAITAERVCSNCRSYFGETKKTDRHSVW
jgi:predicted glutamine amidotransferase